MKAFGIRVRLTFWYGCVLAGILLVLGVALHVLLGHALLQRIDATLSREIHETEERLEEGHTPASLRTNHHGHHREYALRVIRNDGRVLTQDPEWEAAGLPLPSEDNKGAGRSYLIQKGGNGRRYRVLTGAVQVQNDSYLVQFLISLESYDHELAELRVVLLTLLPAGFLLAVAGGYWLAGRAIAPVQQITATARRISARNLRERIPIPNLKDELGQLADTLNSMFARLERTFDALTQFTADASHELRTPLTAIRTEVEIALRSARTTENYEQVLGSVLEEVERLTRLADSLLLLSREDAGATETTRMPVRLDEIVLEVAGHARAVAEQADVNLTVEQLPACTILGDADRLRQVMFNLFDNAVKYNRPGGEVTVRGKSESGNAVIEVVDNGLGIPTAELEKIFDRFYRVDKSRSRHMGGTGLGLSIARSLIESHHGRIEVESAFGKGSSFRIILPLHITTS